MSDSATEPIGPPNILLYRLRQRPLDAELHEEACRLLGDLRKDGAEASATYQEPLADVLEVLLAHDFVKHREIAGLALEQLKLRHGIDADTDPAQSEPLLQSLSRDNLFLLTMRRALNTDLDFETFLRKLRGFLLLEYQTDGCLRDDLLPLVEALAQQCFNNEHIWNEDESEQFDVQELATQLERDFSVDSGRECEVGLLLLGMYRPLADLPLTSRVCWRRLPQTFSDEARPALTRLIYEPLEERRLMQHIPHFGEVVRPSSQAVRAQYEENPYPRWFNLRRTRSLKERLERMNAEFSWPDSFPSEGLDILVPGCGTGQHPLGIARGMPDAHVLALDLSKASLAYAQRMANKLGASDVEFLHCDLLDVPKLGRQFHHIDCFGVLHHLKDPISGWRALNEVLLPGGTLGIGVYSKVARMHIRFLRAEIKRLGIPPEAEAMKAFRQQLLTDDRYSALLKSLRGGDFFSVSSVRDLLFHASEYHYSMSELQEIIEHFGYRFLGFKARGLKAKYLELFPDDPGLNSFANWRKFEPHYAGSGVLLSFYLQKT